MYLLFFIDITWFKNGYHTDLVGAYIGAMALVMCIL